MDTEKEHVKNVKCAIQSCEPIIARARVANKGMYAHKLNNLLSIMVSAVYLLKDEPFIQGSKELLNALNNAKLQTATILAKLQKNKRSSYA